MEIKDIANKYGIIGVIGDYKSTKKLPNKVSELDISDIKSALKMVGLKESIYDKEIKDLTISENIKIDLINKINDDVIIIGGLSKSLIYKDLEYIKKLLIKLNKDYDKTIIVIDNNIETFFNFAKQIIVLDGKNVIYQTNNFYDERLYEYVNTPKIIGFIKYINNDKKVLSDHIDIYELIKDIYRVVS